MWVVVKVAWVVVKKGGMVGPTTSNQRGQNPDMVLRIVEVAVLDVAFKNNITAVFLKDENGDRSA